MNCWSAMEYPNFQTSLNCRCNNYPEKCVWFLTPIAYMVDWEIFAVKSFSPVLRQQKLNT